MSEHIDVLEEDRVYVRKFLTAFFYNDTPIVGFLSNIQSLMLSLSQ